MTDLLRIDLSIDKEFFKIKTRTNGPRKNHTTWRDQKKLSIKVVEGRAETEGATMNHGSATTKLLGFQKPFAGFYGKTVRVKRKSGLPVKGMLLWPMRSCILPARKLYLENEKGNVRGMRIENVESIEIIGVTEE
jgi:hypothetical protein